MSALPRTDAPRHRPHESGLAAPFLEFDLSSALTQLHAEAAWESGRNARTLVKYDDLRIVLMALKDQARIPVHRAEGRISIQTLVGHLRVQAEGRTFDLREGGLLTLERGVPHEVEALGDSAFLLTIAWPKGTTPGA